MPNCELTIKTFLNPQPIDNISLIAVGSLNPVKIEGASQAVSQFWPQAVVQGVNANSEVSEQPSTNEESIQGAINRAKNAMHNLNADLGIGLEGSTFESPMGMMLTGWVAIIDKTGRQGLGGGGGMLLPPVIAQRIRAGEELGPVMDSLTGHANIKHQMGTVGLLSCGTIERTESFRQKVLCALVPFLHPTLF